MSASGIGGFVQLQRTFNDLRVDADAGDDGELRRAWLKTETLGWNELQAEYRVVVLAEAGAGKTAEVRAAAQRLRADGKAAFFMRIEHLARDVEDAFEVGHPDEFDDWLASGEEGWLLLDSVDEARLASPKDFETAMRRLSRRLRSAMQRVHLVITGRTTAWRPRTDLQLCSALFPYEPANPPADKEATSKAPPSHRKDTTGGDLPFRIVALGDLNQTQIGQFLRTRGVDDPTGFLDAVERADAAMFTARPQDLEELAGFWLSAGRIGSRLEIMRSSLDRRLTERDQDRAIAFPLSGERSYEGARLVAAATTLTRQSLISVPDAVEDVKALSIQKILTGWNTTECIAFVSRPIFDEAIYGTIRFHHRSVREYLTAEWLHRLLVRGGSRRRIEELFFREQYGVPVVVPAMRPILPWLAILDERILQRVLQIAPEIIFEGGDPRQLPPETRRSILRQVCEQLAQPAHGNSPLDYSAVQRFAGSDISQDIKSLITEFADDNDIVWFLLRLVWHGELAEATPEAKQIALTSRDKDARLAAFRALRAVGSADSIAEVRSTILTESTPLLTGWLAELITDLPEDEASVDWLTGALASVEPPDRYGADSLLEILSGYVDSLSVDLLSQLMFGMADLLAQPPHLERRTCRISERYQWIAQFATRVIARLIEARAPTVLQEQALSTLSNIPVAQAYHSLEMKEAREELPSLVAAWDDLNHALFWFTVREERARRPEAEGPLVDFFPARVHGSFWSIGEKDFALVVEWVRSCPLPDDRQVALTLAFAVYTRAGRPRVWREKMKRAVTGQPELEVALDNLLHPPAGSRTKWRAQERRWKQQRERHEARRIQEAEKSKEYLQSNLDALRSALGSGPTRAQEFLHHKLRDSEGNQGHWSTGNWKSLVPEFGDKVAEAYREGAVEFWRTSRPLLVSEGGAQNSTPFSSILGLTGLVIEAREQPDWPAKLSDAEVELAVRYALEELNGFPPWLPGLYTGHPEVVLRVIIHEIMHELATETGDNDSHYVLYDASWSGQWMWDRLGPSLLPELAGRTRNIGNLRYLLTIIQGSSVPDEQLATVAASSVDVPNIKIAAVWFATWVGVDPVAALPELDRFLDRLNDDAARTQCAMMFATHLLGNRRTAGRSRQAFRSVQHLKRIYILLNNHVRRAEDIERAGNGVYSPTLRDDAQDARNAIFGLLKDTPGKEAFLALSELSLLHPDDSSRPWMAFHAKAKAQQDADAEPWTLSQLTEFNADLERTPSNHRDLWELALSRMLDLKADIEQGDASIAAVLRPIDDEVILRNFIGSWCRDRSAGRYSVPQEEELADARRPDLRFHGVGFDGPVPLELKIADKWTGPKLFERLENQLCGDYLRDERSTRGMFVLIYRGQRVHWELPDGTRATDLTSLVTALQNRWAVLSDRYPGIEDVRVIGIDLCERAQSASQNQ